MEKILKYSIFAIIGLLAVGIIAQLISGLINPRYGYGYGGMMGGYGMGFGMIGGALFLIIIAAIIMSMLERDSSTRKNNALDLLDKRYAGGEINREEYIARKKDLEL